MRLRGKLVRWLAKNMATRLPRRAREILVSAMFEHSPYVCIEAIGPQLNREPDLDHMPFDLPPGNALPFEHLAGLFASNSLNHGVVGVTIRMAAYMYGLTRQLKARKCIDIGRHKGGSVLLLAAAMGKGGEVWSVDIGEKELRRREGGRSYDEQLSDLCERRGLTVHIIVGDSRTVEMDTGEVDLVFIDAEHTYDAVKSDFHRFGKRVRVGGAVLFDDCSGESTYSPRPEYIVPLLEEIVAEGDFKFVKTVDRMGHFERVRRTARRPSAADETPQDARLDDSGQSDSSRSGTGT